MAVAETLEELVTHAMGIGVGSNSFVCAIGNRPETLRTPAVLYSAPDSSPILGPLAAEAAKADSGTVFRDFTGRVGDPVPIVADGVGRTGADLVATAVECLVSDRAGGHAEVAVAYPSTWTEYAVRELAAALTRSGRPPVLVSAAGAGYTALTASRRIASRSTVLLCDVGCAGTNLAVVGSTADGAVRVFVPTHTRDFGGDLVDSLLVEHVLADVAAANPGFDPRDRWNWDGIRALRRQATIAKERLSRDVAAVLEVNLLGIHDQQRIVRAELEGLIAEPVRRVVRQVSAAIEAADRNGRTVEAIVLTGGGAAIPLLAEQLSGLGVPLVDGGSAVDARGAALIAARVAASRPHLAPAPRPQDRPLRAAGPAAAPIPAVLSYSPRLKAVAASIPVVERRPESKRPRSSRANRVIAAVAALAILAGGGVAAATLGHGHSTGTPVGTAHVDQAFGSRSH